MITVCIKAEFKYMYVDSICTQKRLADRAGYYYNCHCGRHNKCLMDNNKCIVSKSFDDLVFTCGENKNIFKHVSKNW